MTTTQVKYCMSVSYYRTTRWYFRHALCRSEQKTMVSLYQPTVTKPELPTSEIFGVLLSQAAALLKRMERNVWEEARLVAQLDAKKQDKELSFHKFTRLTAIQWYSRNIFFVQEVVPGCELYCWNIIPRMRGRGHVRVHEIKRQ